MKLKYIYCPVILMFIIGMLFSCIQEDFTTNVATAEKQIQIRMSLKTAESNTCETYALSEATENKIDNVYVLFINKSTGLVYSVTKGNNVSNITKTFSTVLTIKTGVKGPFECFLLVNHRAFSGTCDVSNPTSNELTGKTYAEVQRIVRNTCSDQYHADRNGCIEMWGKSPVDFSASSLSYSVSIPLIRLLARVDIGIGGDGVFGSGIDATRRATIPFKLENVYIYQPNGCLTYFPSQSAIATMTGNVFTQNSAAGDAISPDSRSDKYGRYKYEAIPQEIATNRLSTQRSIYLSI